jgi:transposase
MRKLLTNGMWSKLEPLLPAERGRKSRPSKDNRLMLEGMLWKMRTGCPWRDLPPEFGPWMSVYTRFNRWCRQGVLGNVLSALQQDVDWEWLMMDSSAVRAHQHAHGAQKKPAIRHSDGHVVVLRRKST